jgi:hypothetical protein
LVDDAARYISINFLKKKDEVAQKVIEYLLHLKTHGKFPKAIRMDHSKEIINETLGTWCHENGIDIQMTAPYSPSQNRVVERVNRTVVALARVMINKLDLPHFLWEFVVSHMVYLRIVFESLVQSGFLPTSGGNRGPDQFIYFKYYMQL